MDSVPRLKVIYDQVYLITMTSHDKKSYHHLFKCVFELYRVKDNSLEKIYQSNEDSYESIQLINDKGVYTLLVEKYDCILELKIKENEIISEEVLYTEENRKYISILPISSSYVISDNKEHSFGYLINENKEKIELENIFSVSNYKIFNDYTFAWIPLMNEPNAFRMIYKKEDEIHIEKVEGLGEILNMYYINDTSALICKDMKNNHYEWGILSWE